MKFSHWVRFRHASGCWLMTALLGAAAGQCWAASVPRFAPHEVALRATGQYANPYAECAAEARLTAPDGKQVSVPLFWDGGTVWKFRFAPAQTGVWQWRVQSADQGLNGQSGAFDCAPSKLGGGLQPMPGFTHHFARQDGRPIWFIGDTAWALFTDNAQEQHDRAAALTYLEARARQGFNVVHSMLLSEAGWGNQGGLAFDDLTAEKLNPAYFQEVDLRVVHANRLGLTCGMALAWGDKGRGEKYAWAKFPSPAARERYARYIAARYAAMDTYFIVSGEWHAEITRRKATEEALRKEFIELGRVFRAADPHGRMMAIHPMTRHGSVRDFNTAGWMSFGDYQQNYEELHERVLLSRSFNKPVVNSEYGYLLRDQSGDGVPDKDNSTSVAVMRQATWDIVMAGGYVVTGFGTTYFGGNRDPGPFAVNAAKNQPWEAQMGHLKSLFTSLEWWKLVPRDDLLTCEIPRGKDEREFRQTIPPKATYWCLAEPGRQYVFYARGLAKPVQLQVENGAELKARRFDPRTGEWKDLPGVVGNRFEFQPSDAQDWVVVLAR